jgi:hypothetical protein
MLSEAPVASWRLASMAARRSGVQAPGDLRALRSLPRGVTAPPIGLPSARRRASPARIRSERHTLSIWATQAKILMRSCRMLGSLVRSQSSW